MSTYDNINSNVLVNPLFVQAAIEAGIAATIRSIVNGQPMDLMELLLALRQTLWDLNRPLAEGLNKYTLMAILNYLSLAGEGVAVNSQQLPIALDMNGPDGTWVSYDTPPALNVTWTAPPTGYTSLIVLDGVIIKHSSAVDGGQGTASDSVSIALAAGDHIIRVVYRRIEDGALSRLGYSRSLNVGA